MTVTLVGELATLEVFPKVNELLISVRAVAAAFGTFTLAFPGVVVTLDAVIDVLVTLEGAFDFVLNASFGLGALKLSAMLEFQGAFKAMANLTIAMSNPLAQAALAITAMATATASLQASISLGMPTVSAELGLQLSILASVSAAAAAKMAGIQAVMDAALSAVGPLINGKLIISGLKADLVGMIAPLTASFNLLSPLLAQFNLPGAGVHLYTVDCPLAALSTELASITPAMSPGANVKAVVLLVDTVSHAGAWVDLQFMLRTTP